MKKLLFWIVFCLAFFVRFWKFEYIPFANDSDELAHVFAGQSLLQTGRPVSWTSLLVYEDQGKNKYGNIKLGLDSLNTQETFKFVQPWFDHPPLMAVIQGSWVKIFGYQFPSLPPSIIFRFPFIIISSFTLYFIYLISKRIFGFYPAIFSLSLAGFSPVLIFGQRMAIGENLYTLFILLSIYLIISAKQIKFKRLFILIALAVLSGLTKITGLVVVPIVVYYFLQQKNYRLAIIYSLVSLVIFGFIYALYGYLIDWSFFVYLIKAQSSRLIGWTNPAFIFSHPGFQSLLTLDASYYLILLLGIFSLFINSTKQNKFLQFSIFFLLIAIWITSAEKEIFGWYKLPLFALLTISSAGIIKVKTTLPLLLLISLTIVNNFGLVRYTANPNSQALVIRGVIAIVFGSLFIISLLSEKIINRLKNHLLIALMCIYCLSSIYIVDKYYEALCQYKICPLPEITSAQLIKNLVK